MKSQQPRLWPAAVPVGGWTLRRHSVCLTASAAVVAAVVTLDCRSADGRNPAVGPGRLCRAAGSASRAALRLVGRGGAGTPLAHARRDTGMNRTRQATVLAARCALLAAVGSGRLTGLRRSVGPRPGAAATSCPGVCRSTRPQSSTTDTCRTAGTRRSRFPGSAGSPSRRAPPGLASLNAGTATGSRG